MKYIIYPIYVIFYCILIVLLYASGYIGDYIIEPLEKGFGYNDLKIK